MKVKGTGINTTREFVKYNFPEFFKEWIDSLPETSRSLFLGPIPVSRWFDAFPAYYEPVNRIISMFYNDDPLQGGIEIGRFSAEMALRGMYSSFLMFTSPEHLMRRASAMMNTYYKPSEVSVKKVDKNTAKLILHDFQGINKAVEYRIAGWCQRALELCNCTSVRFTIHSFLSDGADKTEITFSWE